MGAKLRALRGRLPPEQEEVVTTEAAAEGQQNPMHRGLNGVADADISEFHRLAVGAVRGQHTGTSFLVLRRN